MSAVWTLRFSSKNAHHCELFTGHGEDENGCLTPRRVEALIGLPIALVACGSRHTVAVTRQGVLYSWGDRESGVAGHGDMLGHQYTPRLVERLAGKRIVQISVRFACIATLKLL